MWAGGIPSATVPTGSVSSHAGRAEPPGARQCPRRHPCWVRPRSGIIIGLLPENAELHDVVDLIY
jgi:hypothetical protein